MSLLLAMASCVIPLSERLVFFMSDLLLGELPSEANWPHLHLARNQSVWYYPQPPWQPLESYVMVPPPPALPLPPDGGG